MAPHKPFAESCVQNRGPIQQILQQYVDGRVSVLEIGSGTGQHAVYFAEAFPQLHWQTSDLQENHAAIQAWIDDSQLPNVLPPIALDCLGKWPAQQFDLLFTANTIHIMSQRAVEGMFTSIPRCMHGNSILLMYGPFNYQNQYTSESNARFDQWLKQRDPDSGIKNFEWVQDTAARCGLECIQDHTMPANNRVLAWRLIQQLS